jgi:hypothetical protein
MTQLSDLIIPAFEIDEQLTSTSRGEEEKFRQLRQLLILRIDELLLRDADKLKNILYRIDVNEKKLQQELESDTATPAAEIMADAIIKRQIEKIESRKLFGESDGNGWADDL